MKKTFLKVSVIVALAMSMSTSFVGCKDYDGDITSLKEQNSELGTQYQALQKALEAAKLEATNAATAAQEAINAAKDAKASGDAATAAAQTAAAQAELAKQAAADAKKEAIEEVMAQVQTLMQGAASKDELATLAGKVAGIEKSLNLLGDVDQLVKDLQAAKIQIKALEEFRQLAETKLGEIPGMAADINTLKTDVNGLLSRLKTAEDAIKELQESWIVTDGKIQDIEKTLEGISTEIDSKISAQLNTLAGVLFSRLTSVSYIPDAYVDGIPTIDFASATYKPMTPVGNTSEYEIKSTAKSVLTSCGATAEFFTHPYGVKAESVDLAHISIVGKEATSRAGEAVSNLISVNGTPSIAEGKLTISLRKATTGSLNPTSAGKINIVSFKIPVNKNTEYGETQNPIVYSEFIRIAEQEAFTPEIAKAGDVTNHFEGYSLALNTRPSSSTEVAKVKYSESLDLKTLVTGRKKIGNNYVEMDLAALKTFNLEPEFELVKETYVGDDGLTNQQTFATIENGVFSVPNKNANAVGRMPVVLVKLVDTANKNVVDARYFKILITKTDMTPIVISEAIDLGQALLPSDTEKREFKLDWQRMNSLVYAKIGASGMSKTDFANIYTATPELSGADAKDAKIEITKDPNADPASTNAIVWTMDAKYIGKIVDKPNSTKEFNVTVTCKDPSGTHADVVFSLKAKIYAQLATAGTASDASWLNNIYQLEPVIYVPGTSEKCKYDNNIWGGFIDRTLVKSGNPTGTWDIQFDETQPSGYKSNATSVPNTTVSKTSANGYQLNNGTTAAAELTFNAGHKAWYELMSPNTDSYGTHFSLVKNNAGKSLLDKNVTVGTWVRLNAYNVYKVASYNMHIVKPLTINAVPDNLSFKDGVIGGSKIETSKLFTMKDFHGNLVAKPSTVQYAEDLYNYYDVGTPTWNAQEARAGITESGVINDNLDATKAISLNRAYPGASISEVNGCLVFNNPNVKVQQSFNLFVNVSVDYGFGHFDQWIKIRVNPSTATTASKIAKRRK